MRTISERISALTQLGFFGLVKLLFDHPLTICAVYALLIYYLPLSGWLVVGSIALCIFAHEAGHMFSARMQGYPVENFSVGLPSKWVLKLGNFRGTSIQVTPYWFMGGYVDPDLRGAPFWRMAIVMLSGVAVNLLISIALFSAGYAITGKRVVLDKQPVIVELSKNVDIARSAGMRENDLVLKVNRKQMDDYRQFAFELAAHKNETVKLEVLRRNETKEIWLIPTEQGQIGVNLGTAEGAVVFESVSMNEAIAVGFERTGITLKHTGEKLLEMLHLKDVPPETKPNGNRMHGLVAVVDLGSQALSYGIAQFMFVVAVINANLFLTNLLPLPILDGGQLLLLGFQKWRGQAFSEKVNSIIEKFCIYLMLVLLVVGVYNDIFYRLKF